VHDPRAFHVSTCPILTWPLRARLARGGITAWHLVFVPRRRPQMRQQTAERDLIGRMRARDGNAVAELAATYGPRIQQLAFRYLKNHEDAEEVAQDVLMKVYRKIDAFRGDAALSSWI